VRHLIMSHLIGPVHQRRSGFTLVDLLITISLVSVMAAIGIPVIYPALVDYRMKSAIEEVQGAVDYCRSKAMITGNRTRVTFDTAAETLLLEEERLGLNLVTDARTSIAETEIETLTFQTLGHPLNRGENYQVQLSGETWEGIVELQSADFGGSSVVVFDKLGRPSSGGQVVLLAEGVSVTLTLDATSGRLSE
jgi:Tfp pilus assembly protein FimT